MNAYDIEIEYDEENENYYAEHEFAYPSKRVRLNIDTDNSLWPTDESNSMTITIPSNPQTDTNNTWDDTTKTLTLTNLDQNTLITNNQNPSFNYATDLNINLSNYQSSVTPSKINIKYAAISGNIYEIKNDFISSTSNINVTIPNNNFLIEIFSTYDQLGDPVYYINLVSNQSNSSINYEITSYSRYFIIQNTYSDRIFLLDENNNKVMQIIESNYNDNKKSFTLLYKSYFNIILN